MVGRVGAALGAISIIAVSLFIFASFNSQSKPDTEPEEIAGLTVAELATEQGVESMLPQVAATDWPVLYASGDGKPIFPRGTVIARGQYAGPSAIEEVKNGFQVYGVNGRSTVWLPPAARNDFYLSFNLTLAKPTEATPLIWLRGPGYGASEHSGLVLQLERGELLRLTYLGKLVGPTFRLQPGFAANEERRLDFLLNGEELQLYVDNDRTHTWSLPDIEHSPLSAFIGLGTLGGSSWGGQAVRYSEIGRVEDERGGCRSRG